MSTSDAVDALAATATRHTTPCGAGVMVWHEWGAGPPLVLLHGGAGSWRHWVRTIPMLSRTRRVLVPDLPGLGESADPAVPHSADSIADTVASGLAELLAPDTACDLVGFSFGSVMAGHLTARHPGLVRSLTLVGAGGLGLQHGVTKLVSVRDKDGVEREAANRTNLALLMIADPARIDAEALCIQDWNSRHTRTMSGPISRTPILRRALERIRVPVGAIWGERDAPAALNLPARVAMIQALQPDAPVRIIPDAGHWVAYEAPDAFNAVLADLLRHYARNPAAPD